MVIGNQTVYRIAKEPFKGTRLSQLDNGSRPNISSKLLDPHE